MIQSYPQRKQRNSIKKTKPADTKSTLIESFKGYLTNMSYGFSGLKLGYFSKTDNNTMQQNKNQKVYILGEQTSVKESLSIHQDIIWLTYKKNIDLGRHIHSDVGWGCLIRVAQMALAHSIKKYFYLVQKKIQKKYIITTFLEEKGPQFKYNVCRFVEAGMKMWNINIGQWYSITQVSTILEELHNVSPLKGCQYLKVKVFSEIINISQVLKVFQLPACRCQPRKINCIVCQTKDKLNLKQSYFQKYNSKSQKQTNNQSKKHLMLIITTKLGQKNIDKPSYDILLELISLPIFNGCLGGIPNKARFLTGKYMDKISYLDPHYVQSAVDQMNLHKKIEVFQCKQIRYMTRQQLDPQMGLCFYLSGVADLQLLINTINKVKKEQGKLSFLRYEWNSEPEFQILDDPNQSPKNKQLKQNFQDLQESFSDLNNQSMQSSFMME